MLGRPPILQLPPQVLELVLLRGREAARLNELRPERRDLSSAAVTYVVMAYIVMARIIMASPPLTALSSAAVTYVVMASLG